jgi:hypothetical protein
LRQTISEDMSEEMKYEQKIARDELIKDEYRQIDRVNNLVIEIAKSQGRLLETVGLIKFLFVRTKILDNRINTIEHNNRTFATYTEEYIIKKFSDDFDEGLNKLLKTTDRNTDQINQLSESLSEAADKRIDEDVKKYIIVPIDFLLQYMQKMIDEDEGMRYNDPMYQRIQNDR